MREVHQDVYTSQSAGTGVLKSSTVQTQLLWCLNGWEAQGFQGRVGSKSLKKWIVYLLLA